MDQNIANAAQAFRRVPQGFFAANETLNAYAASTFTQMVLDLLQSFSSQSGTVPPAKYVELTGLSAPLVASTLTALTYLFRLFISHAVQPSQCVALLAKETDLSEEKRLIIATLWSDYCSKSGELLGPSKVSTVGRTLSLGRLVHFSWRVGVGLSSSKCENLAAPFVTLSFDIAQPTSHQTESGALAITEEDRIRDNGTRTYIVECTHHEFQEVRKTFQDIFSQLDSI